MGLWWLKMAVQHSFLYAIIYKKGSDAIFFTFTFAGPWGVLKTRAWKASVSTPPEKLSKVFNAYENHVWSLLLHKNTRQIGIFEENAPVNLYFLGHKTREMANSHRVLKTPLPGQIPKSCWRHRFTFATVQVTDTWHIFFFVTVAEC